MRGGLCLIQNQKTVGAWWGGWHWDDAGASLACFNGFKGSRLSFIKVGMGQSPQLMTNKNGEDLEWPRNFLN